MKVSKWDDFKIFEDFLKWADRNEKVFNIIDVVWKGVAVGAAVGGILYIFFVK